MKIDGNTLIAWGYEPGPWFGGALTAARKANKEGMPNERIRREILDPMVPPKVETIPLRPAAKSVSFHVNLDPESPQEWDNARATCAHMDELMRTPTAIAGAIMPDACPSGSQPGTIPVGGVVETKAEIHPGWHSSDICCSMAISVFDDCAANLVLDAGMKLSHFGPTRRKYSEDMQCPTYLLGAFESNRFLNRMTGVAQEAFASQGDGNHFFYVGRIKSTGQLALVTHHGSRKPGALLYKQGMYVAEQYRAKYSPETPKHNAWIPIDTVDGEAYWAALQLIRTWTKKNHFALHDGVAKYLGLKVKDRWWNEHNFVFRKLNGHFFHAKGATPAYPFFSNDTNGLTLIPLNMAEPILITKGLDAPNGLGFAPHGAGRNLSRTAHLKSSNDHMAEFRKLIEGGLDIRSYCGVTDHSELPSAYKNAAQVRQAIEHYGLAEVVDEVIPYGSIMAGDWERDAPWRKKRDAKSASTRSQPTPA